MRRREDLMVEIGRDVRQHEGHDGERLYTHFAISGQVGIFVRNINAISSTS